MDQVARSLLLGSKLKEKKDASEKTNPIERLMEIKEKSDKLDEENPEFIPDLTVELGPQFHVEHRIKNVFEEPLEVRNYSLEVVAAHVSQLKHSKPDEMMGRLSMQVTESEDPESSTSKTGVQEEELGNMLNNLGFRLNDACLLTPGDQSKERGRGSSLTSPRAFKTGTKAQSRNPATMKVSKSKSAQNFSLALQKEADPLDNLLDGEYLNKLQQKMAKPSIVSVVDQVAQTKAKDDASAKSAVVRKGSKTAPKKKTTKSKQDEDLVLPLSSKVRTKLASVNQFTDNSILNAQ